MCVNELRFINRFPYLRRRYIQFGIIDKAITIDNAVGVLYISPIYPRTPLDLGVFDLSIKERYTPTFVEIKREDIYIFIYIHICISHVYKYIRRLFWIADKNQRLTLECVSPVVCCDRHLCLC